GEHGHAAAGAGPQRRRGTRARGAVRPPAAVKESGSKGWHWHRCTTALAGALFLLAGRSREAPPVDAELPPPPKPDVILIEPVLPERPPRPELPPLFRDIERRTFQFFWDTTNEQNGLTPDRYPSRPFASVASIGYALTAYPIGIENGWVSRT